MRSHLPSRVPNRGKKETLKPTKLAELASNELRTPSDGEMIMILAQWGQGWDVFVGFSAGS